MNSGVSLTQAADHSIIIKSGQQTFDGLFYKRLQHIERVLDEDPLELEKFKNYFQSVLTTKRASDGMTINTKPLTNLLLSNSNHKGEFNNGQDNHHIIQNSHSKAGLSTRAEALGPDFPQHAHHNRRAGSQVDQYPPGSDPNATKKKVVYQVKQTSDMSGSNGKKQISLKAFNEMKFNGAVAAGSEALLIQKF